VSDRGDVIDRANDVAQAMLDANIAAASKALPKGEPGVCEYCGFDSPRLINQACARCRDELRLP